MATILKIIFGCIFIVRQSRYWYSNFVCLSIRPSVCPWRSDIRWKRLNILS